MSPPTSLQPTPAPKINPGDADDLRWPLDKLIVRVVSPDPRASVIVLVNVHLVRAYHGKTFVGREVEGVVGDLPAGMRAAHATPLCYPYGETRRFDLRGAPIKADRRYNRTTETWDVVPGHYFVEIL